MKQINETTFTSDNGLITFIHGDCMEFMAGCRDNEFDLNVSDPPYFDGPDKLGYYGSVKSKTKVKRQSYNIIGVWDVPGEDEFKEFIRVSINQIIWGINYYNIKNIGHGRIVWDVPGEDEFKEFIRASINQIIWGINYYNIKNIGHGRIVWDKKNDSSTFSDGEIAYCSYIETVKFFRYTWNGMLQENMKNKQDKIHPTEKPIALYRWIFKNYAKPTDKILDCFGGSMSSAIAAHMEGLKMTIIELDREYFDKAIQRFSIYEQQQTINFE